MIVAYDGTDFFGWQAQPHGKTIVNCLQDTFKKVFDYPISVVGASRTDTGVHAAGQVAKFMAPRFTDVANLMRAWNASLPPSVLLRSMIEVPHGYNPQKNVVSKTYYYHLFINRPLPFFMLRDRSDRRRRGGEAAN